MEHILLLNRDVGKSVKKGVFPALLLLYNNQHVGPVSLNAYLDEENVVKWVVGNTITWTSNLYMGMGIPDEKQELTGIIKAIDKANYIVTITCDGRDILMDAAKLPKK